LAASLILDHGNKKNIAPMARLVCGNSAAAGLRFFLEGAQSKSPLLKRVLAGCKRLDCWTRQLDDKTEPTRGVEKIRLISTPRWIGRIHEPAR
jgi:hypothetical protein